MANGLASSNPTVVGPSQHHMLRAMSASDGSRSVWSQPTRRRRAVVAVSGVAIHGGLLLALLNARLDVAVRAQQATIWTKLLPMPQPPQYSRSLPRSNYTQAPRPVVVPTARAQLPAPPAAAALVATAPASGASAPLSADSGTAPLRLTLTPGELRALEAGTPRTLAQSVAAPPAGSLLAQRLAPAPQFEEDDRNGVHTVRTHGGCFILVPSGQAKTDPFNHGGERVAGRATNDNC